jgi:hypothetical protein
VIGMGLLALGHFSYVSERAKLCLNLLQHIGGMRFGPGPGTRKLCVTVLLDMESNTFFPQ